MGHVRLTAHVFIIGLLVYSLSIPIINADEDEVVESSLGMMRTVKHEGLIDPWGIKFGSTEGLLWTILKKFWNKMQAAHDMDESQSQEEIYDLPKISDGESSYSYVIGAPNGPQNWGNLNPNWTLCGTGRRQSPINIVNSSATVRPSLGDLNTQYRPAPARIVNRGHDIEVTWTRNAGGIILKGTAFKLVQLHWHIPSEHTVNGIRFDMELHIVHSSSNNNIAVVGILYKLGKADPFLAKLKRFLPSVTHNGMDIGIVNPRSVGFPGREYYRYNGSLTTPPCSQNVTWKIFKTVKTVSSQQILALRNAVTDGDIGNSRPIQPLNGRHVYLFRPRPYFPILGIASDEEKETLNYMSY